jgi:outer membrane protein, multidrug efflux system
VFNEIQNLQNLQKTFDFRNEEVSILLQAIQTSNDLFRTGRATYLEVLITQQNLLNSKVDLITTKKYQLAATVNIYKALGGGWK